MDQSTLGHPGDQGQADGTAGKSAPAASGIHPFDGTAPYHRSTFVGLDDVCGIDADDSISKTYLETRVDKEMRQIRSLAEQRLWHGVHVALCWYTKSLVTSGRPDAIAMVGEMKAKVAEAKIREPSLGWGDFPEGRILWTGPLKFPAAFTEAGEMGSEAPHSIFR